MTLYWSDPALWLTAAAVLALAAACLPAQRSTSGGVAGRARAVLRWVGGRPPGAARPEVPVSDPCFPIRGFQFAHDLVVGDYVHSPDGVDFRLTHVSHEPDGATYVIGARVDGAGALARTYLPGSGAEVTRLVDEDLEPA